MIAALWRYRAWAMGGSNRSLGRVKLDLADIDTKGQSSI
jgi:hypothetical protein